jgi:hypothetical protein
MTASWDVLAELAERELALIEGDRLEELADLAGARAALVEALPATPPASARPALERAAELQEVVTHALAAKVAIAGAELERVNRGRNAMRSYAGSLPHARAAKLVDRTG